MHLCSLCERNKAFAVKEPHSTGWGRQAVNLEPSMITSGHEKAYAEMKTGGWKWEARYFTWGGLRPE